MTETISATEASTWRAPAETTIAHLPASSNAEHEHTSLQWKEDWINYLYDEPVPETGIHIQKERLTAENWEKGVHEALLASMQRLRFLCEKQNGSNEAAQTYIDQMSDYSNKLRQHAETFNASIDAFNEKNTASGTKSKRLKFTPEIIGAMQQRAEEAVQSMREYWETMKRKRNLS